MRLPTDYLLLFQVIILIVNLIYVNCDPGPGPGTIYYRKPTKLVYYKKFPPVLIYPKSEHEEYTNPKNPSLDLESYEHEPHGEQEVDHINNYQSHEYFSDTNGISDYQHNKHGKYFLLNPKFIDHLMQYEEKFYIREVQKKPVYDNWLAWLFGVKSKEKPKPVHTITFDVSPASPPLTSYAHFMDSNYEPKPIYTYHPKKPLNTVPPQHLHLPQDIHINHDFGKEEDVKPVVEHIEDDIKYDFRTKTHSYNR